MLVVGDVKFEYIVCMMWYVIDKKVYVVVYFEIGKVFCELIGSFSIVMMVVEVVVLVEDCVKVEIEVMVVVLD